MEKDHAHLMTLTDRCYDSKTIWHSGFRKQMPDLSLSPMAAMPRTPSRLEGDSKPSDDAGRSRAHPKVLRGVDDARATDQSSYVRSDISTLWEVSAAAVGFIRPALPGLCARKPQAVERVERVCAALSSWPVRTAQLSRAWSIVGSDRIANTFTNVRQWGVLDRAAPGMHAGQVQQQGDRCALHERQSLNS